LPAAVAAPEAAGVRSTVLRTPAFRTLWMGDGVARLGYQIAQFLLPLLVVTVLHASATQVGLVSAAQFVPVIALSLVAGVVVDRAATKTLLMVCNAVRGAALGLMGLVYATVGLDIWLLVATAVVVGSMTVFYDVGYQATVPRVLSVSELVSGNGLLQATNSATQMAGPAAAGAFVQLTGLPTAVGVTGALFAGAAVGFGFLRLRDPAAPGTRRPAVSVTAGLRFTWRSRAIRDLCVQSGLFNLHEEAFLTAFLVYAIRTRHIEGGTVGLIVGLGSVGALVGSLVTGRLSGRLHAGRAVSVALLVAAVSLLGGRVFAELAWPTAVLAAGFLVNGVAQSTYNVYAVSLRQAIPPPEYLGSVTASYRLVSFGTIPLGALLGGVLTDALGAPAALLAVGVSMTVSCLALFASPLRRARTVDEAREVLGAAPVAVGIAAPVAAGVVRHVRYRAGRHRASGGKRNQRMWWRQE
jgi:MFS family permease